MGFLKSSWMIFQYFVFLLLCLKAFCDGSESEVSVRFLKTPHAFSNSNSAAFVFQVLVGGNGGICSNCTTTCKLDDGISSNCNGGEVSYTKLQDGIHKFEVCTNQSQGFSCSTYNWTLDTIPPTANVIAATSFTNALNVSINISFSEPCYGRSGRGGFNCSSVNACNLLVYGDAQVAPDTLLVLQSNLQFSLIVKLSSNVQYGRVVIVMDTSFCKDAAGNKFTRTKNSSFIVHFDRRRVFVNLRTHVPEKQLQLNSQTRTVLATNKNLKVYLYFTEPILNSSAEILNSLKTSQGFLLPTKGSSHGNRRFGFQVENISTMAIVTLSIASNLVISRQGMPVSPTAPITFLYDSERPAVKLSAAHMKTRENIIPIWIKFIKPVFGLKASHISILGGHLQRSANLFIKYVYNYLCIASLMITYTW